MKDPKKVKQSKRLVEWNHKNKEKLAHAAKDQENETKLSQAYNIIAVRVSGLLGYYIHQRDNNATKV